MPRYAIMNYDGLIVGVGSFATEDDAVASCSDFGWVQEVADDAEITPLEERMHDGEVKPLLSIPDPEILENGHRLEWLDPPPGLTAKVYDLWIDPPYLLVDTSLSLPECALHFTEGGNSYRVELSAAFPYRPRTMEVNL